MYEAWSLLYELLARTTLRNVARLLNVHNFLKILQDTLQQSYNNAINQKTLIDVCVEGNLGITDSSSTTVEASPVEEPKKSRKRKRTDSKMYEMKDDFGANYEIEPLYFSVCRVIERLNIFVTGLHDDSHGFVVEHLKASLKGGPERIAEILGISLHLANISLRKIHFSNEDHRFIVAKCISSSIGFWKTCLATADDPSDKPSNVRRKWIVIEDGHS